MVTIDAKIVSFGQLHVSKKYGLWQLITIADSESELVCLLPNEFIGQIIDSDKLKGLLENDKAKCVGVLQKYYKFLERIKV
jgi:hypothetical protein